MKTQQKPPLQPTATKPCRACGALNDPKARFCWMCGETVDSVAIAEDAVAKRKEDLALNASIWGAILLVVLVGYGLVRGEPLLAGAYLIIVTPAILAAGIGAGVARAWSGRAAAATKVVAFTVMVCVMVPIALLFFIYSLFVGLLEICTGMVN